jgi:hypothetical protein
MYRRADACRPDRTSKAEKFTRFAWVPVQALGHVADWLVDNDGTGLAIADALGWNASTVGSDQGGEVNAKRLRQNLLIFASDHNQKASPLGMAG